MGYNAQDRDKEVMNAADLKEPNSSSEAETQIERPNDRDASRVINSDTVYKFIVNDDHTLIFIALDPPCGNDSRLKHYNRTDCCMWFSIGSE